MKTPPTHSDLIETSTSLEGYYINYRLQPNLTSGIFGNIDYLSERGVGGWVINFSSPALPIELEVVLNGQIVGAGATQLDRPDVANLANVQGKFGFEIPWYWDVLATTIAGYKNTERPPIQVIVKSESRPILPPTGPTAQEIRQWIRANALSKIGGLSISKGVLEGAFFCGKTNITLLFGWLMIQENAEIWAEDQENHRYSIELCYEWFRPDVYEAIGKDVTADFQIKGFVGMIQSPNFTDRLTLRVMTRVGPLTISKIVPTLLPDHPVAAARSVFNIQTPEYEFSERVKKFDVRILRPLQESNLKAISEIPIKLNELGHPNSEPMVSVIIPIYGRLDFIEDQLIEFASDEWLKQHAEIIYVLDDPSLVHSLSTQAQTLYRLYKFPFRWIFGSVNRGFSGANNLGASVAKGNYLLFMNSDVFPQECGWLKSLVDSLANDSTLGAISPRLVFQDGSIQHAGMEYVYHDELGIWINHHPYKGLDPSLDPNKEITKVQAITGACLLICRKDFDLIGGWDQGYLIGDFEDSDLCMRLRVNNLDVAYNPNVQLTHLERQSFSLFGQHDFRSRVMRYNAVRFQSLWQPEIDTVTSPSLASKND